jgi:hypothetical protein
VYDALTSEHLIIEGVTAAGKSSTIGSLQKIVKFHLVDEDATLDDFLLEFFADPDGAARKARDRMMRILDYITGDDLGRVVLERFHFSMLALGSGWHWYRDIDKRCAALNCKSHQYGCSPGINRSTLSAKG